MQRLFSMFPAGQPGVALLLMRVALAVMLLDGVAGRLLHLGSIWFVSAPAAVAIALCLGFFTPVMAAATVLLEIGTWVMAGGAIEAVHVCAVLDAIALGLLGPGMYSLDAKLFGRRRVVLRSRGDSKDR